MPDRPDNPFLAGHLIRAATHADSEALLAWRNDPTAYEWYSDPRAVNPDEHDRWLSERLDRDSPAIWMVDIDGVPSGSARLDLDPDAVGIVSVVVDQASRGQGVGRELLGWVDDRAADLGLARLHAVVHRGNAASHSLFLAAGYEPDSGSDPGFVDYVRVVTPR